MKKIPLGFNIQFEDLYTHQGISNIDACFIKELASADCDLHNRLVAARAKPGSLDEKEQSELIIDAAPHVEDFIAGLFGITKEVKALQDEHHSLASLYSCKRLFVQRKAIKQFKQAEAETFDGEMLQASLEKLFGEVLTEQSFAHHVTEWLEDAEANQESLELAAKYAAWAVHSDAGKHKHRIGVLFKVPKKLQMESLVPLETAVYKGVTMLRTNEDHVRQRDGFSLTDDGGSLIEALDQTNYCIYCHNQGKDSCSKGLKEKDGSYKKTAFNVTQAGCPLEEHISELNMLKSRGVPIGALAAVTINNPMCAGTGHRICNDCMKSCIYQKQDPVDIPKGETRTLRDVLELPWGFEIYSLLTRWNPLNLERPVPKAETGYNVLVVGLGPAGFTLAHHLLNEGHTVVAVDGLKIEPIEQKISGVSTTGKHGVFEPIKDIQSIFEDLDERVLAGFGGVAEYGITVRWNKNYLKVIRLLLERRNHFGMIGGVRFGSTLNYQDALDMGFDHIALAMGAGKPTVVPMKNNLVPGVRTASDFLMALQLTGAAKKDSIANLQMRLPVVVIGGGLTAVDTATESLAYYPVQVEKFLRRYETLVHEKGEAEVRSMWTEKETIIADEFIAHAHAIREEYDSARREKRDPDIISLLKSWGGVTLAYRRRLIDAPSYRLNHEEVEKAMEEGINFIENATPLEVDIDTFGDAEAITLRITTPQEEGAEPLVEDKILPARAVFMAAGTSPNTVLHREDPEHFELDGKYFQAIDLEGNKVAPEWVSKPEVPQVLISFSEDNKATSFFGDLHPSFAGNVVKAMGSAKQGYPVISKVLSQLQPSGVSAQQFIANVKNELVAVVHSVERLTPTIVEVVVKAPMAARKFKPGQFYRFQNYEANALFLNDNHGHETRFTMEGLALTGAWVDEKKGLLSMIVLEMGGSSDLCIHLQQGEQVVVMGPTGEPTHTPAGETVMLVGGGLGNAVLFSIGKALKDAGSKVLYFAGYKKSQDRYKVKEIEKASDIIIWCCDEAAFTPERPQDRSFHGNIVEGMLAYAEGRLGNMDIPMPEVDRIITIGSDRMMAAVTSARHAVLKPHLKEGHIAIGSINSPMQCMMKEICAQCLQKHIDPETGEEVFVYSCFNQDQLLDHVSFPHLNERLSQNTVQEKLTKQWINYCLQSMELRKQAA